MKILHLSSPNSWRGGEQQITYLCQELIKMNVEQVVASPHNSALLKKMTDIKVEKLPYRKVSGLNLSFALMLKKICLEKKIDLIHVHDSHAHTAAYISALLGNKTPVVVSRRVDFKVGLNPLSLLKYNHKSIAHFICVSDAIKKVLYKTVLKKEKISTIHSGIDISRYKFRQKSGKLRILPAFSNVESIIGNTCALADHKDLFTFINAAAIVIDKMPLTQFVIIGEGHLHDKLSALIDDMDLHRHIHLIGFREDAYELISDFDLFFMTSKTEGLGTSILDAFASGIPVVSTNAGGITEIVQHNKTGLVGPVKDAKALANLIMLLLNDEELKIRLADNAYKLLPQFSKEVMAQKTFEVYKKVLKY